MGKNNRARRAAKAKQRRAEHHDTRQPRAASPGENAFGFSAQELAGGLFDFAAGRMRAGDQTTPGEIISRLSEFEVDVLDGEIERVLRTSLAAIWAGGWQPSEIVRQVRRSTSAAGGRLAANLVVADHAGRLAETLDPAWLAQVAELRTTTNPEASDPSAKWLSAWYQRESLERLGVLQTAVSVLCCLYDVGPLSELMAPPGRTRAQGAAANGAGRVEAPMLTKVRALLAQAESTTFPAEAEAFTAKAQELMTRHAIDHALLHEPLHDELPHTRRIPIEDPYVDAKSYLLHVVAEHSRCRAIYDARYALCTVVGFEPDLDAAELLFTSLLVQAQVAVAAEARHAPAGARTRSRSFRSSFLVAYAARIGERLALINQGVIRTVEAETKRSTLPVLASRRQEVEDTVQELFGELHSAPVRTGWDGFGGMRGKQAADQAQLAFADLTHHPSPMAEQLPYGSVCSQ